MECGFKSLSVAKFGGSLLDVEGKGIPKIVKRIKGIREKDRFGPIAVFSAPMGCTDALMRIGESYAESIPLPLEPVFEVYARLAKAHVKREWHKQALDELAHHKALTQAALDSVNKRFSGNVKARILTFGGELAMSTLADYVLKSNGLDSCRVSLEEWPIVTDDNFEDAMPNYGLSRKRIHKLIEPLEDGKILCIAGFLGVTADGLETLLGRGGSDLTAVFASCLLKDLYSTETLLYKDVPVQSADPKVVGDRRLSMLRRLLIMRLIKPQ